METSDRCVVAGSLREPPPGATMLRAADPGERIDVTIVLKPARALDAAALESNALKPASERQFATAADLAPAPEAIADVAAFAKLYSLDVGPADSVTRTVTVSGTVANMERAFGTTLNAYALPSGEQYRSREGTLTVPCALAAYVVAVMGLTTLRTARPHDSS